MFVAALIDRVLRFVERCDLNLIKAVYNGMLTKMLLDHRGRERLRKDI